ncbi:integrase core domain-containing protein [Nonomuraea sp. NBC_00507]
MHVFPVHHASAGCRDRRLHRHRRRFDNALMESQIGLYKTELIKPRGPWRSLADVELATAEWVDWFNATRLHSAIGHLPPEEYEALYYAQYQPSEPVGINR